MKQLCFFFLSFLLLLAAACHREKKITPDVSVPDDSANSGISTSPATPDTFRGLFVVGKKNLSFRRCEQPEKDYAVVDSTGEMKQMYKEVFLHSPAFPYEYVYVEVTGEMGPTNEELFSQGYDSVLAVKEILVFEQKNYQNSCIPYDYWAIGKDWSLQISQKEGVIVLKDYAASQAYVFEYFYPKLGNDATTYSSNNYAVQASIKAVIRRQACEGDSAQSIFDYSASVLLNGKRYSGCAVKGT